MQLEAPAEHVELPVVPPELEVERPVEPTSDEVPPATVELELDAVEIDAPVERLDETAADETETADDAPLPLPAVAELAVGWLLEPVEADDVAELPAVDFDVVAPVEDCCDDVPAEPDPPEPEQPASRMIPR
jgi:hypothetical protein